MPLLHRFSCSTRTGATGTPSAGVGAPDGSPMAFGSVGSGGMTGGTPSTCVGAPDGGPITFGSTVLGGDAAAVHPARTPTRQPTTAAHKAWLRRFAMAWSRDPLRPLTGSSGCPFREGAAIARQPRLPAAARRLPSVATSKVRQCAKPAAAKTRSTDSTCRACRTGPVRVWRMSSHRACRVRGDLRGVPRTRAADQMVVNTAQPRGVAREDDAEAYQYHATLGARDLLDRFVT